MSEKKTAEDMGKGLLLTERETSTKWFMTAFYGMALIPVFLLAEFFGRNVTLASVTSAVLVVSLMAGMILYSRAMFKSFHYCIYCDADYQSRIDGVSMLRLVLFKLGIGVAWLFLFFVVAGIVLWLHTMLLNRMPEQVMEAELIAVTVQWVTQNFGTGIYLIFTVVSLFFQAITLVSLTHVAASASHLRFCNSYKALAGMFLFVLLYFFENDFAVVLKRMIMQGFGGIENLLTQNGRQAALGIITGIEVIVYLMVTLVNVMITCYFLKKTKKGE